MLFRLLVRVGAIDAELFHGEKRGEILNEKKSYLH
jgi:hypothetical protein